MVFVYVGAREIGYFFGQYKRIKDEYSGALTGKGLSYGGSLVRSEATGYGLCYFANAALNKLKKDSLKGKTIIISGTGNVGFYALEKATQLGAKVVAMRNSRGWIYDENGINPEILKPISLNRGTLDEYANQVKTTKYYKNDGKNPSMWSVKCDIALPCATQNELNLDDAKLLVKNGVMAIFEGANMPSTLEAIHYFIDNGVIFGPGKACNAGGVATSGLEMSQNSMRLSWTFEEVEEKLKNIMENIFNNVYETSRKYGVKENDLLTGANIAGFEKISQAMLAQGVL